MIGTHVSVSLSPTYVSRSHSGGVYVLYVYLSRSADHTIFRRVKQTEKFFEMPEQMYDCDFFILLSSISHHWIPLTIRAFVRHFIRNYNSPVKMSIIFYTFLLFIFFLTFIIYGTAEIHIRYEYVGILNGFHFARDFVVLLASMRPHTFSYQI